MSHSLAVELNGVIQREAPETFAALSTLAGSSTFPRAF
jgi:hypothetical protein